jgi:hypothetical protein
VANEYRFSPRFTVSSGHFRVRSRQIKRLKASGNGRVNGLTATKFHQKGHRDTWIDVNGVVKMDKTDQAMLNDAQKATLFMLLKVNSGMATNGQYPLAVSSYKIRQGESVGL